MREIFIFNRQGFPKILFYFLYLFMIFLISGCGGGGGDAFYSDPSETGSASFNIAWHDAPVLGAAENAIVSPSIDCEGAGVSTIICEVYDGSNTYLTSQDFACSAGQGTISDVPVGTNREIVILGEDADGNILYHGTITGITVTAGQINDAGTIDTHPFYVSDLLSPTDGKLVTIDKFSLNWTSVETAYKYRILISKDFDFETIVVNTTTANTSYTPLGLLEESTTYYWKVYAFDIHANQSAASDIWSFTVTQEPVPIILDYVTINGVTQVDENSGAQYTLTAYYSDGSNANVTGSASWSDNSDYATISSGGYLTTLAVTSDQSCTITASYGGKSDTHSVIIKDVAAVLDHVIITGATPFPSRGGDGSINVTTSADDCNWTATVKEDVNWITITPDSSSGSGKGTVYYSVKNNPHSYRSATIMVAGESYTVTQDGK